MSIAATSTGPARPPSAGVPAGKVGFFSGLGCALRGVGFVATHPATWPYALVPAVVLVTLGAAAVGLATSLRRAATDDVSLADAEVLRGAAVAGAYLALNLHILSNLIGGDVPRLPTRRLRRV